MLFIPHGGLRMQGVRYGGAEHEVDDWKGGLVETAEGGGSASKALHQSRQKWATVRTNCEAGEEGR
jgi:hypothetical protein